MKDSQNNYKGHMDKFKGGWNQGREVGVSRAEEISGRKMEITVLEQQ